MVTIEKLKAKGWSEEDIEKYRKTMEKHRPYLESTKNFHRLAYWFSLLILTICNLFIAVFLVPFLLALQGVFVYVIVGVLGTIFGLLFSRVIQDIEHIEMHHHIFAAVFIPMIAVINIFVMVAATNKISEIFQLTLKLHPIILSCIYVACFLTPYLIAMIRNPRV